MSLVDFPVSDGRVWIYSSVLIDQANISAWNCIDSEQHPIGSKQTVDSVGFEFIQHWSVRLINYINPSSNCELSILNEIQTRYKLNWGWFCQSHLCAFHSVLVIQSINEIPRFGSFNRCTIEYGILNCSCCQRGWIICGCCRKTRIPACRNPSFRSFSGVLSPSNKVKTGYIICCRIHPWPQLMRNNCTEARKDGERTSAFYRISSYPPDR